MKDKIILYGGFVLTLIGTVAFFYKEQYLISSILLAVIIIGAGLFYYIDTMPIWTVISYHQVLEISDSGNLATLTIRKKLRANHKGQTEILHKGIRGDGEIKDFRFSEFNKVPDQFISEITHEYTIREKFNRHLGKWEKVDSCLICDLINCFPGRIEGTGYIADYSTHVAKFEVSLPQNKPARNPKAFLNIPGDYKIQHPPTLEDNGTRISWEKKNIKPGQTYEIEWEW